LDFDSLNIPIYLNQKIVFDLLATIENGFSQMSSVQTFNESKDSTQADVVAKIGVSNVFAFLGINLKSSLKGEQQVNDGTQVTEDRVHTPASLFQRLRQYLQEEKQIKLLSEEADLSNINSGDFIEINGTLRKNPVVDLIEGVIKLMELAVGFEDKAKGKGNQPNENKKIMSQMQALCDNLKSGNMIDLICDMKNSTKIVLPTYLNYFNNSNMNEIIEGNYKILGKVSKIVKDENDEINLLRNTSFSMMQKSMLDMMFSSLSSLEKNGLKTPEISTNVQGPALMIIPIAIFL
jgi:hypothetical protein